MLFEGCYHVTKTIDVCGFCFLLRPLTAPPPAPVLPNPHLAYLEAALSSVVEIPETVTDPHMISVLIRSMAMCPNNDFRLEPNDLDRINL